MPPAGQCHTRSCARDPAILSAGGQIGLPGLVRFRRRRLAGEDNKMQPCNLAGMADLPDVVEPPRAW